MDWAAEIAADGPYSQQRILSPGLLESISAVEGSLELPPTLSSRGPCDSGPCLSFHDAEKCVVSGR